MTLADLIQERIKVMFSELANDIYAGRVALEPDAGNEWDGVPIALFVAEHGLLAAWAYLITDSRAVDEAVYEGVS